MNETFGPWEYHYSEILSCRDTAPGYDQGCSCTNCEDACYTPTDPTTTTTSEDPTTPWVSLHCEMGHSYFFSSESLSWLGAEVKCRALGGELLSIGSLREQNCLMKYA